MIKGTKPKIIVTRKLPSLVEKLICESFDAELNPNDDNLSEKELKLTLEKADGILCTVSDKLSRSALVNYKNRAQIISNFGVGVSNIDLMAAKEKKIVVTNTPDVLTESTADIALFLILAITRKTSQAEKKLREKDWCGFSIVDDLGISVKGKTLGIIGMGRIGQATAKRAFLGLGMEVIFYNRSKIHKLGFPAKQVEKLDELIEFSDVISVHIPGGDGSPILKQRHFQKMKRSSFIVNTARGDVIDEKALIIALKNKKIAGAGLDVYKDEPMVSDELCSLPNVTLLPHIGSATIETREAMGMVAYKNLLAHFSDKNYVSRVV